MDAIELKAKRWLKENKDVILVKGNPMIPGAKNGYSILDTKGNVLYSELSWNDVCLMVQE